MPSASSKPQVTQQQVAPVDLLQEPIKTALSVAEKKLRNLEKRRLKLLETKKKADKGEELNDDQKAALKSLEALNFGLEAVKDVQKSLAALEQDYTKLLKKDQKRQKQEQKDALENRSQKYVFDVVDAQAILGEMSEDVRPDFLAGSNGACLLTEADLENLDGIYELINPVAGEEKSKKLSERSQTAGQHLVSLVEGKNSAAIEEVTYKDIHSVLQNIKASGYFDKEESSEAPAVVEKIEPSTEEEKPDEAEEVPEPEPEVPAEESPVQEEVEAAPVEPVNGVDLPPDVQTTPEEEGINFMGESEISAAVQEASLNPVSPEFVPRKMQSQPEDGFEGGDKSEWQQIEGGHSNHQGGNYRGRGGRGRGRGGGFRGRGGNRDGTSNYRGGNREYRGGRGGSRGGSGNYRGNRDDYRGNREGGRGSYRGGNREGGRGNYRGGQGGNQQQQQQQ